jgi:hypothetical protein
VNDPSTSQLPDAKRVHAPLLRHFDGTQHQARRVLGWYSGPFQLKAGEKISAFGISTDRHAASARYVMRIDSWWFEFPIR